MLYTKLLVFLLILFFRNIIRFNTNCNNQIYHNYYRLFVQMIINVICRNGILHISLIYDENNNILKS